MAQNTAPQADDTGMPDRRLAVADAAQVLSMPDSAAGIAWLTISCFWRHETRQGVW